mmetsp:Transcript_5971/g.16026  ORF Transcript_5971/g.16026 Transcript_5971/m.16026 type:complete len:315 (+) Transcript_5971:1476-2420(+)
MPWPLKLTSARPSWNRASLSDWLSSLMCPRTWCGWTSRTEAPGSKTLLRKLTGRGARRAARTRRRGCRVWRRTGRAPRGARSGPAPTTTRPSRSRSTISSSPTKGTRAHACVSSPPCARRAPGTPGPPRASRRPWRTRTTSSSWWRPWSAACPTSWSCGQRPTSRWTSSGRGWRSWTCRGASSSRRSRCPRQSWSCQSTRTSPCFARTCAMSAPRCYSSRTARWTTRRATRRLSQTGSDPRPRSLTWRSWASGGAGSGTSAPPRWRGRCRQAAGRGCRRCSSTTTASPARAPPRWARGSPGAARCASSAWGAIR